MPKPSPEWTQHLHKQWMAAIGTILADRRISRLVCFPNEAEKFHPEKWIKAWGYNVDTDETEGWDGKEWRVMTFAEFEALCDGHPVPA